MRPKEIFDKKSPRALSCDRRTSRMQVSPVVLNFAGIDRHKSNPHRYSHIVTLDS